MTAAVTRAAAPVELRPRALGDLLSHILEVSADQFGRLFLIQLIARAPVLIAQVLLEPNSGLQDIRLDTPPDKLLPLVLAFYGKLIGITLLLGLVLPIEAAASTFLVRRLVDGEPPRVGACLREALGVWPRTLLLTVTFTVITFLATMACFVPGIVATVMFFAVVPAFLVERLPWTTAFGRSRELVGWTSGSGRFFEVLVVYLVTAFAPALIVAPVLVAASLIPSEVAQILIGHLVTLSATVPAQAAAPLVYYHLRVVRESHDIERLARLVDELGERAPAADGAAAPAGAGVADLPPPPGAAP